MTSPPALAYMLIDFLDSPNGLLFSILLVITRIKLIQFRKKVNWTGPMTQASRYQNPESKDPLNTKKQAMVQDDLH